MEEAVIVAGMQEGYVTEQQRQLALEINDFLDETGIEPLFARFMNQEGSNFVEVLGWEEMFEPEETRIVDELQDYVDGSNTFKHHTYSALTAEMQEFIEREGVETIYLCGLDTDATILDTAFHAFNTRYDVRVIEDLCGSRAGRENHEAAMKIIERTIKKTVTSGELEQR